MMGRRAKTIATTLSAILIGCSQNPVSPSPSPQVRTVTIERDVSWVDHFAKAESDKKGGLYTAPRLYTTDTYRVPQELEAYEDSVLYSLHGLDPKSQTAHLLTMLFAAKAQLNEKPQAPRTIYRTVTDTIQKPIHEGILTIRIGDRYLTFPKATRICEEETKSCYSLRELIGG